MSEGMFNGGSESDRPPRQFSKEERPSGRSNFRSFFVGMGPFLKKYWLFLLIAAIVVAGGTFWGVKSIHEDFLWKSAKEHFSKADYEQAEKAIRNLSIPNDEERQKIYAQTMLATGDVDKALTGYQKLYSSNKDTTTYLIIGNIYNQKKDYDKAIEVYKEVITTNPANVQAHVNLATVYVLKQDKAAAARVADEAVKKNPKNVTLLELRVSMHMEDKNSAQYRESVAQLKEVNPEDPLLQSLAE